MKRQLVVWGWLVLAALGPGCDGGGGPVPPPIITFGTEPTVITGAEFAGRGNEPPVPGGTAGSIGELCSRACAHIQSMCLVEIAGPSCMTGCTDADTLGCEAEYKAFVGCIGTTNLSCLNGRTSAPACNGAQAAFAACVNASGAI